jgi:hypothetical protein
MMSLDRREAFRASVLRARFIPHVFSSSMAPISSIDVATRNEVIDEQE